MELVPSDRERGLQTPVWTSYQSILLQAGCTVSLSPSLGKGSGTLCPPWKLGRCETQAPQTLCHGHPLAQPPTPFRDAGLSLPGAHTPTPQPVGVEPGEGGAPLVPGGSEAWPTAVCHPLPCKGPGLSPGPPRAGHVQDLRKGTAASTPTPAPRAAHMIQGPQASSHHHSPLCPCPVSSDLAGQKPGVLGSPAGRTREMKGLPRPRCLWARVP